MIVQHFIDVLLQDSGIAGQVVDRVWPNESPDAPLYPYILVFKVGGDSEYDMAGPIGMETARVQVDVYGLSYADTVSLKDGVRNLLHSRPPPVPQSESPCVIDSVMCINDMDSPAGIPNAATTRQGPRIRRRVLEFRVWFRP